MGKKSKLEINMPKKHQEVVVRPRHQSRRAASKEALKQMQILLEDENDAVEIPDDDDEVIPISVVVSPPRKKYKLTHRKSSDGNDREVLVLKSITPNITNHYVENNLELECWVEELEPCQKERNKKLQEEENALKSKIDELIKSCNAEVVYKGDLATVIEVSEHVQKTIQAVQASANKQPNIILNSAVSNPQSGYQFIMDPRLGLVLGSVQPQNQPASKQVAKVQVATTLQSTVTPTSQTTPIRINRTARAKKQTPLIQTTAPSPVTVATRSIINNKQSNKRPASQQPPPAAPPATRSRAVSTNQEPVSIPTPPATRARDHSSTPSTPATRARDQSSTSITPATRAREQASSSIAPATRARDQTSTSITPATRARDQSSSSITPATRAREQSSTSITPTTRARDQSSSSVTPATRAREQNSASIVPVTRARDYSSAQVAPATRARDHSATSTPPATRARTQEQTAVPVPPSTRARVNTAVLNAKPTESSVEGGLAAGSNLKAKAIVDLTSDDGKPLPDSKEISFNKLQGKTFPSLVVVARPHLRVTDVNADRSKLDSKVKSVLMYAPTKFTEWLIQQGLVKSEQKCRIHPTNQLKLGMYSDVSKFPYSGGYVWISECCPQRFVSVFSGSIFEGSPHPPLVILKILYHWACQTNIQNVTQWVKVDNLYVKGMYTWLRSVCTVALQTHIRQLGGPNSKVEVGVISLGTTSQDGNSRQVKVEVLGILETASKLIRLRAIEPLAEGDRNYKKRFSKILEPLAQWVDPRSVIVTDLTVDKATLQQMGFLIVVQSSSVDSNNSNRTIMEYLRKIVPRMFQNTLSLLSRQIIQQFLDELVWREWFGTSSMQVFDNLVIHLAEQTRYESNQSLILRLNRVALNPFKNYAIPTNTATVPLIVSSATSTKPIPDTKKRKRKDVEVQKASQSTTTEISRPPKSISPDVPEQMVPLENYYYGTIDNYPPKTNVTLNMKCPFCKETFNNNIILMSHLFKHAHNVSKDGQMCRYCLTSVPTVNDLLKHTATSHPAETKHDNGFACLICETHYMNPFILGKHMSKEHCPFELPYQCGTCGYRCSNHKQAIDHFYKQHENGPTIQCPFCLKSTTVFSSSRNMVQNMNYFIQHLQKHQRKQYARRCGKCNLWFVQKEILKDHQTKMHASQRGKTGLVPWVAPRNGVMVPKSKMDKYPCDAEGINFNTLYFNLPKNLKCKECNNSMDTQKHFPSFESCQNPNCQYSTCCSNAMQEHNAKCSKNSKHNMGVERLPYEMFCICGYSNQDGNQMAKHLAICERKSAYPSLSEAKSASVTHSMLDVLGLVRKPEDTEKKQALPPKPDEIKEPQIQPASVTLTLQKSDTKTSKPASKKLKKNKPDITNEVKEKPIVVEVDEDDLKKNKTDGSNEAKENPIVVEVDEDDLKKNKTDDSNEAKENPIVVEVDEEELEKNKTDITNEVKEKPIVIELDEDDLKKNKTDISNEVKEKPTIIEVDEEELSCNNDEQPKQDENAANKEQEITLIEEEKSTLDEPVEKELAETEGKLMTEINDDTSKVEKPSSPTDKKRSSDTEKETEVAESQNEKEQIDEQEEQTSSEVIEEPPSAEIEKSINDSDEELSKEEETPLSKDKEQVLDNTEEEPNVVLEESSRELKEDSPKEIEEDIFKDTEEKIPNKDEEEIRSRNESSPINIDEEETDVITQNSVTTEEVTLKNSSLDNKEADDIILSQEVQSPRENVGETEDEVKNKEALEEENVEAEKELLDNTEETEERDELSQETESNQPSETSVDQAPSELYNELKEITTNEDVLEKYISIEKEPSENISEIDNLASTSTTDQEMSEEIQGCTENPVLKTPEMTNAAVSSPMDMSNIEHQLQEETKNSEIMDCESISDDVALKAIIPMETE